MKKTISINRNKDFLALYKQGRFYCAKYLVLYTLPNNLKTQRLGITVSKKVGKSVTRNRLKRLVKENYFELEDSIKEWNDLVFVLRKNQLVPSYYDIKKEMKYLTKKLDILQLESFQC